MPGELLYSLPCCTVSGLAACHTKLLFTPYQSAAQVGGKRPRALPGDLVFIPR